MTIELKRPERLRLGVIGCGPITLNAHADAIAKAGNIQLQALADRDKTLLADMRDRLRPASTYNPAACSLRSVLVCRPEP